MAAWREVDELGHANYWACRYDTVGLDWDPPVSFGNDDPLIIQDLRLAAYEGLDVMAVWHHTDGADDNVWTNRYDMEWGWGDAELIEPESGVPPTPEVAMDPAGNAIVVWSHWDGSSQNIMARRYDSTVGWQTAQAIDDDDAGSAANPHVAMDPAGNAMAVWRQRDSFRYNIWSRHYDAASGQWGEAELVESRDTDASAPRVTVDAAGNAIVVWHQWDDALEHNDIWANHWAPPR